MGALNMSLGLSHALATAERQSMLRGCPMVVVVHGALAHAVSLRSWQRFGATFAPEWEGEKLVQWRDGITTVAPFSDDIISQWGGGV